MFKLLEGNANPVTTYILLGVILVFLIGAYFFGSFRKKKNEASRIELENTFVKGTKILTSFGVYGEIVEISETTDGKVALITTGDNNKTTMLVHINAIMNIDKKQPVIYDKDGNDITNYESIDKSYEINESENEINEIVEDEPKNDAEVDELIEQITKNTNKKDKVVKKTTKKNKKDK